MVNYQLGILNKINKKEVGEVVEDVCNTSLDVPPLIDEENKKPTIITDIAIPMPTPSSSNIVTIQEMEMSTSPNSHLGDPNMVEYEELDPEVVVPDLDTENWMSKLREDEIFNTDKGPAPRLHGLRRLAKPYVQEEESKVNSVVVVPREHVHMLTTSNGEGDVMSQSEVVGVHHFPMVSVTFTVKLVDSRVFSDSADAYFPSIGGDKAVSIGLFPTAVASARAEARCLRKVLGIREHAAEELVDKDASEELAPNDDSPINKVQVKLIEKILQSIDISLGELLEDITTREIFSIEELTTSEAKKALRLLNDRKKKNKKKGNKK